MKRNTIFYEALETAGCKAQYDGHVKKLLSFRQVISQILARTLTEYEGCTPQEAAHWIEPESVSDLEEKGDCSETEENPVIGRSEVSEKPGEGSTVYDLRFRIQAPEPDGRKSELLVNLEGQKIFQPFQLSEAEEGLQHLDLHERAELCGKRDGGIQNQ